MARKKFRRVETPKPPPSPDPWKELNDSAHEYVAAGIFAILLFMLLAMGSFSGR